MKSYYQVAVCLKLEGGHADQQDRQHHAAAATERSQRGSLMGRAVKLGRAKWLRC